MERIGREVEWTLSQAGGDRALALAELTEAWPRAVGADVARRAWPLRIGRDGTLHVATASATWAFELDRLSPEIAERLAAVLGESAPGKVRFRVGPVPEPGSSREPTKTSETAVPVSPEATEAADSAAAAISDPALRELVSRAARASLSRARSGRTFW
jgi:hypothetical protein